MPGPHSATSSAAACARWIALRERFCSPRVARRPAHGLQQSRAIRAGRVLQAAQRAFARDVVVGPDPIYAEDCGAGVELGGCAHRAGEGLSPRPGPQGILEIARQRKILLGHGGTRRSARRPARRRWPAVLPLGAASRRWLRRPQAHGGGPDGPAAAPLRPLRTLRRNLCELRAKGSCGWLERKSGGVARAFFVPASPSPSGCNTLPDAAPFRSRCLGRGLAASPFFFFGAFDS